MNPDQLKAYKRDKSKKFNAHLRDLRLKEKKRISDNQPDQPDDQPDDNLTLQDLMDIFSTLDTKLDLLESKLENKIENKLYETLDTKMDIIQTKLESIIETKISEETFKTNNQSTDYHPFFSPNQYIRRVGSKPY